MNILHDRLAGQLDKNSWLAQDKNTDSTYKLEILDQIDVEMDYTLIYLDGDGADLVDQTSMYKLYYKRKNKLYNQKIKAQFKQKTVKIAVLKVDGSYEYVEIPHYFLCPICLEPFYRPAALPCGHTFCSFCLLQSNLRWSFKKCPFCFQEYKQYVINVILESDVEKALKRSIQADVTDYVITLIKYSAVNAFATGNVVSVRPGYLSKDMREWVLSLDVQLASNNIVKECRTTVDQEPDESFVSAAADPYFIPTKICVVQINNSHFKGTLSYTFPLKFAYFVVATRPHRGAYVISRDDVRITETKFQNGTNDITVYDPMMPKFNQFYDQYVAFDDDQNIYKLIADEPILGKITLQRGYSKFDTTDTGNFLRIGIGITYKYYNSPFLCPACKQLYRLPVQLTCGCDCCYSCARDLFYLKLPCFSCGSMLQKRYGLNSIDKKMILQLYSKVPAHAPMLDKNLPVYVGERIGILIDEPSRINCWVLFGPGDVKYVHSIQLKPVQIVKMQAALVFEGDGIIYLDKYFGVVSISDGKHYYADRSCVNGKEINADELLRNGYKLVDDLRADIVSAKIDGAAQKLKEQYHEIDEIKQKVIERYKYRKSAAEAKYKAYAISAEDLKSIAERRKKLKMVDFHNPDAKFHPGNQMLLDYGKEQQARPSYYFTPKKHKNWIIDAAFKHPDLTFLCSACWEALKRPVVLACGHICCRRCAALYFQSERACLICGACVENFETLQADVYLHEELICNLDSKMYFHGINTGMFAKYAEQTCIVSQVNVSDGLITICHSLGRQYVAYKDLQFLDVVGVSKNEPINLDTAVRVRDHKLSGLLGLVLAIGNTEARIIFETGIEENIGLDLLSPVILAYYALTEKEILEKHRKNEQERRNYLAEEIKRELGINPKLPQLNPRVVRSTQVRAKLVRRGGSSNRMLPNFGVEK